MAGEEYLENAQNDWIARVGAQADEMVPDVSRGRWRSFTMKIRPAEGGGFTLSMRLLNAMGINRVVEPNGAAQKAAKELFAIYTGMEKKDWEILEVRFTNQGKDPQDENRLKIVCQITVHPSPAKA
jgi:hypothetical protein